jgi:hypothetical protein
VDEAQELHMRWTEMLFIGGMSVLAIAGGALYALAIGGYWS